jgi:hypothetical protein
MPAMPATTLEREEGVVTKETGGRDKASAASLSNPATCQISAVNSATYARWRHWRASTGRKHVPGPHQGIVVRIDGEGLSL